MRSPERWKRLVHAFVECRIRGGAWWLYTKPTLPPEDAITALLVGAEVDVDEDALHVLGVPADASLAVRDEYTWRVAGPHGGEAPNIVAVDEAHRWLARGQSQRWVTAEPFERVTDPRWSHATWLDRSELARVIDRYEEAAGQSAPAAYCALLAMMQELERDFLVRLVLWLERRMPAERAWVDPQPGFLRDHLLDLERARAHVRARRRRRRRAHGGDS